MKLVMYAHGGSENHGCEAIVRATTELLKSAVSKPTLLSYDKEQEIKYGVDELVDVKQGLNDIDKKSLDFIRAYIMCKLTGNYHLMDALQHKKAIIELKNKDIALFIGGDNYCYSDVKNYAPINKYMRKKAKKLVLWGTSVEPEILNDNDICEDIRRFDYIVARESLSYEALKAVNPNTILLPDPAFYLPLEECVLPDNFKVGKTVGINLSPLIIENETGKGCTLDNYLNLVNYIIENTDYQIALIPHVVWKSNDDRIPLKKIYDSVADKSRVVLIDDNNCMRQKYIISKCSLFVGARTHSTIAAYSTAVPTLVVGYSVKAKGIAKDLFGTEDNYVVPVQSLKNKNDLVDAFMWLEAHKKDIHSILLNKKSEYEGYKSEYLRGLCNA
jgi:polysaccharide pyruvyl transferase WcaK-like protein